MLQFRNSRRRGSLNSKIIRGVKLKTDRSDPFRVIKSQHNELKGNAVIMGEGLQVLVVIAFALYIPREPIVMIEFPFLPLYSQSLTIRFNRIDAYLNHLEINTTVQSIMARQRNYE